MKSNSYIVLIAFLILLLHTKTALSWKEQSHKNHFVIDAFNLLKLREKDNEYKEISSFLQYIAQGAWDEDFPAGLTGVRANNHYRHAISGTGLTYSLLGLGDKDVDTLTWALSNAHLEPSEEFNSGQYWGLGYTPRDLDHGNMSWEKAINRYGYDYSCKKLAYYNLGFILHLLQDMGVPEHVHDDAHAASGYNGFEMWVTKNYFEGDRLRPNLGELSPHLCESINDCFIDLSKIGYSANRFQGNLLGADELTVLGNGLARSHPNNNSDLARMFSIKPRILSALPKNIWLYELENYNGVPIISSIDSYKWPANNYPFVPGEVKGAFAGEWWPTSGEIKNSANDVEGFYYLELSGDIPGYHEASMGFKDDLLVSKPIALYPAAYLPTPLPEVADQCQGWQIEHLDGKTHLYTVIGKAVIPHVIKYTAGLIKHYQEIVNHPPYIKEVSISQNGIEKYLATWEDVIKKMVTKDSIEFVAKRYLRKDIDLPLEPGQADITITFSEPVKNIAVSVNGIPVTGVSYSDMKSNYDSQDFRYLGGLLLGKIDVPADGPEYDDGRIRVEAKDLDDHYLDKGADLDANPATPARRFCTIASGSKPTANYKWSLYETGGDSNYSFSIHRAPQENKFTATCIFKSKDKGKTDLEIGRRLIHASSQSELEDQIRQHCTTNDFHVSVQPQGTKKSTQYAATCIFMSKTKQNTEIGRRALTASSNQDLGSQIRQHCTTDDFNVIVKYD